MSVAEKKEQKGGVILGVILRVERGAEKRERRGGKRLKREEKRLCKIISTL